MADSLRAPGPAVFDEFRAAMERQDVDAAVDLFAPDATFHSPVVHQVYEGREALRTILSAVVTVFEDLRYTQSYGTADGSGHVLGFSTRVGDRELEGIDMLRAVDGVIVEMTVMVRPYSAATALRERMAALVAPPAA